jgi:hypothetical protein
MRLTFSNAITIAQIELNFIQHFNSTYVLLPELAAETQYGWLIPWAQSDFRFTKQCRLGGNVPFFVDRFTGEISRVSRSHCDFQAWLTNYAKTRGYLDQCSAEATTPVGRLDRAL